MSIENLHIVPDSRFVPHFMADLEEVSGLESHLFVAPDTAGQGSAFQYLDPAKVLHAPLGTPSFVAAVGDLRRYKRVFIHWLLPHLEAFVGSIPPGPLVCWCFWGEFDASLGPISRLLRLGDKTRSYVEASEGLWQIANGLTPRLPYIRGCVRRPLRIFPSVFRWGRRVVATRRVDMVLHWNRIDVDVLKRAHLRRSLPMHEFFYNVIDVKPSAKSCFVDALWEKEGLAAQTVLLVGHSSFPSGNHLEAFDAVKRALDSERLTVISLLSYGDPMYRELVIQAGRRLFGDRFIPVTQLLNTEEYYYLLSRISAAYLNHHFSEGAANIFRILLEGKPLFLNPRSTIFQMLRADGIAVYDSTRSLSIPVLESHSAIRRQEAADYINTRFSRAAGLANLQAFLQATDTAPAANE